MPAIMERATFERKVIACSEDPPFSYALFDLDGFKEFNDQEGRERGDLAIASVSECLAAGLPRDALACSLGGDAWACALPGASPEDALLVLEPVRRSLAPMRMSVGIVGFPDHTDDVASLLPLADEALARAKRGRGNKAAIYIEEKMILKSNYYPRGQLERLAALSDRLERTEASLLREALGELLAKHRVVI